MQSVAVGWQVYEITKRPLDLGYVGLAQFLPGFVLFLIRGSRRRFVRPAQAAHGVLCRIRTLLRAAAGHHWRAPEFGSLDLRCSGPSSESCAASAFPVSRAILPHLVPDEHFSNAVAWNASIFQIATIAGPAIGGIAYALFHGPEAVYAMAVAVSVLSGIMTLRIHRIRRRLEPAEQEPDQPAHRARRLSVSSGRRS